MLNEAIVCWLQSARYKHNIRFSGGKWDISGLCGRIFKICNQQCVGGPPRSITTYRLSVWQEWSWEPLCLNPWQTALGNRKIKGELLIPKTSLATFLSPSRGLKRPHHNWATHDSERKSWRLCFMKSCCCQLIILFHLICIQVAKLTFANWVRLQSSCWLLNILPGSIWQWTKNRCRRTRKYFTTMETEYYLVTTSNLLVT